MVQRLWAWSQSPRPAPQSRWGQTVQAADLRTFTLLAQQPLRPLDYILPRLSRMADHSRLWWVIASIMWLFGQPTRRGAVRGMTALGVASGTVNVVAKICVRRARPSLDQVPLARRLQFDRQPRSTSFPSGHAAAGLAFAVASSAELPFWRRWLIPLSISVAFSRVYVGVHYPLDVLAGSAIGVMIGARVSQR